MKLQTIHIRNMCCQRCVEAVTQELNSIGLATRNIKLGEAMFIPSPKIRMEEIKKSLSKRGFLVIEDEEEIIIEKVKTEILDLIHRLSDIEKKSIHLPNFLEEKTQTPYRTLLKIFRKHKKITIEKYFILQKIEKIKELIEQSNLSFSEMANMLGYKSLQHLSGQFRQITGVTMLKYKKSKMKNRIPVDRI